MSVFFAWIGMTGLCLGIYSLYLWKSNKKQSRFQARLTILFLTFILIPTIPLTLFVASLLTQSADVLLLPGIGKALDGSLATIRLQAEERGLAFLKNHPDPDAWTAEGLRENSIGFAGIFRMERDSILIIRRIRLPECAVPPAWMPSRDFFKEPDGASRTSCLIPSQGRELISVCRKFPRSSLAVVAYPVSDSVLNAKTEITRALAVYNTLSLLKESIIRKNIIWAVASLSILLLAILAVVVAKKLSRGISEPIQEMVQGMRRVASGDFSREVRTHAKDEIRFLIDSFNDMMRELLTTRQKLFQAEKLAAWQEAARRISHEIRNNLTPMFICLRKIKTIAQDSSIPPALAENLGTLEEELISLETMSSSFAEFARMPAPQKIRMDLNGAVRTAARTAENESASVRFTLQLSSRPLNLEADRDQLKRLFHNLIKNAVEASPENGSVCIRTRQDLSSGPEIIVEIEDQGQGMDPEMQKNLFQPYFTTKKKGTGLGLIIAQKIAEDHGGRITIRSEKGKGTLVRVAFG